MTNVTMLTYGRPRLCEQALRSMRENTLAGSYVLTTYDDEARLGTGAARNFVIQSASDAIREDYLYISDNDVYFKPLWLETLIECYDYARANLGVIALGAYNHPYNPPYKRFPFHSSVLNRTVEIGYVQALATQSWLWRWEDWDRFGPFDITPVGKVRWSEDFAISQKIKAAGLKVASVYPPLICNCSITDSFGEKVPGWELIEKEPRPEEVIVK